MTFRTIEELTAYITSFYAVNTVTDENLLLQDGIDTLVKIAHLHTEEIFQRLAFETIVAIAAIRNIHSSSTFKLYEAFAQGEVAGFTVPAINVRILPYDIARLLFKLMKAHEIGPVIFELARSEQEYSKQSPLQFAATILGAAIKEQYIGPVFIQGDHYQVSKKHFDEDQVGELNDLKKLISDSIKAHFYNIDIDASTIVDLSKKTVEEQQEKNSRITAELTNFTRMAQPRDVTITIGGEIGHIGDRNSTKEDFTAFMEQYLPELYTQGVSKISVQTGTTHGGTIDKEGAIVPMTVDFTVLETIGEAARDLYGLAGTVQHGASTLPSDQFSRFSQSKTVEIHLATGIQNIVLDNLPSPLQEELQSWVKEHYPANADQTDQESLYRNRKHAIGEFKEKLWEMDAESKKGIEEKLKDYFLPLFEQLNLFNTRGVLIQYYP